MRHRGKIDFEKRLLFARDDLRSRAREVTERHAERVGMARRHRVDPVAAGAALEAIAKVRSYRIDGHRTFGAFAKAELGLSRATAHRLRVMAAPKSEATKEAEDAATVLDAWLRARGVRVVSASGGTHRGAGRVMVVIDARDVRRIVRGRGGK